MPKIELIQGPASSPAFTRQLDELDRSLARLLLPPEMVRPGSENLSQVRVRRDVTDRLVHARKLLGK